DEEKNVFYDLTTQTSNTSTLLKTNLKCFFIETANNLHHGLATRYLNRLEKRKNEVHDTTAER
ncbi:unnamed protein product, partial [Rotaria socialis]